MPELPEVETIKNYLLPRVAGHRFTKVTLIGREMIHQPSPEEFCRRLVGQTIKDVSRRGKYLLFHLDQETLIVHLKMTGVLLLQPTSARPEPYARAVFYLDNDKKLTFRDQRKFGSMWLVKDEVEVVGKLGPEPLSRDFTPEVLRHILSQRNIPVKALLLDQHLIAGIGNMYADESLFAARINPNKKAKDLSREEAERLHGAIIAVLTKAIEQGGASVDTYQLPDGGRGTAQTSFQVAHRGGKSCPCCNTTIDSTRIRGRSTYFCPRCQK